MAKEYEETEVVEMHLPCPSCGSSDGLTLYSDGHTYCFPCQKRESGDGQQQERRGRMAKTPVIPYANLEQVDLKARGILKATCKKYDYFISKASGKPVQVANYIVDGEVVGQKIRWADKTLMTFGSIPDMFYGQWLFPGGGKRLIVVEGEIDCLTVSQISGNKYPVVSIPKGSGSAKKTFLAQLKWLETFEEVVVLFDMDTAGQDAVQSIKGILSPGKLKIATISLKDPNEMLLAGLVEELTRSLWNAEEYRPDGIINGNALKKKIRGLKEKARGEALPWDIPLNDMIRGLRGAEITLVTAGSGIGKSTTVKAIAHCFGKRGIKIGCMFLEESPEQCAQSIMSVEAGLPLHLEKDDEEMLSEEAYNEAFESTLGTGNFVFYDHFGSIEGDNLISQMRYMAVVEGCKFIILDHISIAISGLEGSNERRIIDKLMTDLASLTQETGVGIIVISHLRKTDGKGKSHEEGGKITLDDLRGSGALKQLSFTVIALERNQQEEDPRLRDLIRVRCLKCRFTGNTGIGGFLWFNKETNSLEAVNDVDKFLGVESGTFKDETQGTTEGGF